MNTASPDRAAQIDSCRRVADVVDWYFVRVLTRIIRVIRT